jgi:hypothetical protein
MPRVPSRAAVVAPRLNAGAAHGADAARFTISMQLR